MGQSTLSRHLLLLALFAWVCLGQPSDLAAGDAPYQRLSLGDSTHIEVRLETSGPARPGELVDVDLIFSLPYTYSSLPYDSFAFTVAYDPDILHPYDVLSDTLPDHRTWELHYEFISLDCQGCPDTVLNIWGMTEDNAAVDSSHDGYTDGRILKLQFLARDDSALYGDATGIDFFWSSCTDNRFCTGNGDTILIGESVFNSDGSDITDENQSLPAFTGPSVDCIDVLQIESAVVLKVLDFYGGKIAFEGETPTDISSDADGNETLPEVVTLHQNYPNPFNPHTTIQFDLVRRCRWRLQIINITGQVVDEMSGIDGPGSVTIQWDGCGKSGQGRLSSGVYVYRLLTLGQSRSRRMILLK